VKPADVFEVLALAFSTGELDEAGPLFRPDYFDHQQLEGSDLKGPEEFTAVVTGARRSLDDLAVRVRSPVTRADDLAVAVLGWRGRDRSGALVERETVEVLRLDVSGRIVEHWGLEIRRALTGAE